MAEPSAEIFAEPFVLHVAATDSPVSAWRRRVERWLPLVLVLTGTALPVGLTIARPPSAMPSAAGIEGIAIQAANSPHSC